MWHFWAALYITRASSCNRYCASYMHNCISYTCVQMTIDDMINDLLTLIWYNVAVMVDTRALQTLALQLRGEQEKYGRAQTETTMSNIICKIHIQNEKSDAFQTRRGLRQADALVSCVPFQHGFDKAVRYVVRLYNENIYQLCKCSQEYQSEYQRRGNRINSTKSDRREYNDQK